MKNLFRNLFHFGLPGRKQENIRGIYNRIKYGRKYRLFLNTIRDDSDPEKRKMYKRLSSLGKKAITDMNYIFFPYKYVDKYINLKIKTYKDDEGFYYVLHNGKRLYGQLSWNGSVLARYYKCLIIEQDKESAHCYFRDGNYDIEGEVIADFGAAEGIFGLEVVEKAKKLYLFECNQDWIEPLKKTFAPWGDKVEIIQKYIAEKTTENTVSMDDFFSDKQLDFIKADIEGYEVEMIEGGKKTMKRIKRALICLYHRYTDEKNIINKLIEYGFTTEVNPNYLIFFEGMKTSEWARRGIVKAVKPN